MRKSWQWHGVRIRWVCIYRLLDCKPQPGVFIAFVLIFIASSWVGTKAPPVIFKSSVFILNFVVVVYSVMWSYKITLPGHKWDIKQQCLFRGFSFHSRKCGENNERRWGPRWHLELATGLRLPVSGAGRKELCWSGRRKLAIICICAPYILIGQWICTVGCLSIRKPASLCFSF